MEKVIVLEKLTRRFGKITAVSDLSLEIGEGEAVGFLGPNGAGKSTTIKMMANLLKPTAGRVMIRYGDKLTELNRRTSYTLLKRMGFLIEVPAFYPDVTPRMILKYFARLKGYSGSALSRRIDYFMEYFGLQDRIDDKFKSFSKGMIQKVGIVSALIHDPDIIILDEPYTGLDPAARISVRDLIMSLKKEGKTFFISSHLLYEISEIADRIAMIYGGRLIAFDTPEKLGKLTRLSVIRMDILDRGKISIPAVISDINEIVSEIIPREYAIFDNGSFVEFDTDSGYIKIAYNGVPENRYKILKLLIEKGIKVSEFSVPSANLLEDLYMHLIKNKTEDSPK